jgi:hypothetical protein
MSQSPRITAAAIKVGDRIVTGERHGQIMQAIWQEAHAAGSTIPYISQDMQGFFTDSGQFVNRFQAGSIAFTAGQTKTRKEWLHSEDLW